MLISQILHERIFWRLGKGALTTINVPTAIRWITSSKTAAAGTNYLSARRRHRWTFPLIPEKPCITRRSATQSTATGTWDMALLFYDKNLLPVTGTEWNDRLQFSVPSASEQSKSGSTIVPAGAAYAAFLTVAALLSMPERQQAGARWARFASRTQDGATVGVDWSSNVSNIPMTRVSITTMTPWRFGFRTFSDWLTGDARPTGWDVEYRPVERNDDQASRGVSGQIHTKRVRRTMACRTVTWGCGAASCWNIIVSGNGRYLPWQLIRAGEAWGQVELFSAAGMASAYFTHVPFHFTVTGVWQRVPFTARVPSGARSTEMRI